MALQTHNISLPNDGNGDQLRTAFEHQNQMNQELYESKVDKIAGKDLSSNDFTNELRQKLIDLFIASGANVMVIDPESGTQISLNDSLSNLLSLLTSVSTPNAIISIGPIEQNDDDRIYPANAQWRINNQLYTNAADIVITIPIATDGFQRIDRVVATVDNTFVRIAGEEDENIPLAPDLPANTVQVDFIYVFGNQISGPEPISPMPFITKASHGKSLFYGTGVVSNIPRSWMTKYVLMSSGLISVAGISSGEMMWYEPGEGPFPGQRIIVQNVTGSDVLLKNNDATGEIKFNFPIGDFSLKNNSIAEFSLDPYGNTLDYIGSISSADSPTGDNVIVDNPASGTQTILNTALANIKALIGGPAITKQSRDDISVTSTGVLNNLTRSNKSKYILSGALTSIGGLTTATDAPASDPNYNNQEITLQNRSGQDISILHNAAAGEVKFYFPNQIDFNLRDKESITFYYDAVLNVYYFSGQKIARYNVLDISANTTLDERHNGKTLLIGANVTITVPTGLSQRFQCNVDVLPAFTATFAFASGTTVSGNLGLVLGGDKMAHLYQRTTANTFRLKGETSA